MGTKWKKQMRSREEVARQESSSLNCKLGEENTVGEGGLEKVEANVKGRKEKGEENR